MATWIPWWRLERLARPAYSAIAEAASPLVARLFPKTYKKHHELTFWRWWYKTQGEAGQVRDYPYFFTAFFGIDPTFYAGKRILDIGCGPLGTLEWASMASERVGVDPLAKEYLKLGADKHQMKYVAAPSENIPFADEYFDVACAFNCLDHVDDIEATSCEIKRIVKRGGLLLIIVEVNHPPTACEPISLSWDFAKSFQGAFKLVDERRYEIGNHDIYTQLARDARFNAADLTERPGILVAKLVRN